MAGIPLNDIVQTSISNAPQQAQRTGFGTLMVVTKEAGDISIAERFREYNGAPSVGDSFGTSSEIYKASQAYFSQVPSPTRMVVGMRYEVDQSAVLRCGSTEATVAEFQAITDGSFDITLNGNNIAVTGLNFAAGTDFTQISAIIQAELAGTSVSHDGQRFYITTTNTGTSATISFARTAATPSGTDISTLLQARQGQGIVSNGIAGETITESLAKIFDSAGNLNYGVAFTKEIRDGVVVNGEDAVDAAAAWGQANTSVGAKAFFTVSNDLDVLDRATTNDIISQLKGSNYTRTYAQFSSFPDEYPEISVAARGFTVNFNQANSTITLKFKSLPAISYEQLTISQKNTLVSKGGNAFVLYGTTTPILIEGQMVNGSFFDELHGSDWLEDAVKTEVFNLLLRQGKVPYTEVGVSQIRQEVEKVLEQGVRNGFIAPFSYVPNLVTGEDILLPRGYEVTTIPVRNVPAGDKTIRLYPDVSFRAVLAGAIHKVIVSGSLSN